MKITIIGAGPVGILLSIFLSTKHSVKIFEKRYGEGRNHGLNISKYTINEIIKHLIYLNINEQKIHDIFLNWSDTSISTTEIRDKLIEIAEELGVVIYYGRDISNIEDSVIIGADGAHSIVRKLVFNDLITDEHNVQYMAQLKYITLGSTSPRKLVSAMSYSFLNGLSGSDMVIDFESLAPVNDSITKPGTLHIPIPESIYNLLSENNRGKYDTHWTPNELSTISNHQISKLRGIIDRYNFSLSARGGVLGDPKITVFPLKICRSVDVFKFHRCKDFSNKLVVLVGDSSSSLIFEEGLNKGWLEAIQCDKIFENKNSFDIANRLSDYSEFSLNLYEKKRDEILEKHNKIISINNSTSVTGIILTSVLGLFFSRMLSKRYF